MSPEELALAYYLAQSRQVRRTADRVQALWRELDRRDLTGSWESLVGPEIVRAVALGQAAAASGSNEYVSAVAIAEGDVPDVSGRVRVSAFAGHAADGRSLDSLLYLPVITTKESIAAGLDEVESMMRGLNQLLRMAASEVADAGRGATGAAITASRTINGYVRVVNPPACARCIILAGKEYGWNAGFQRHPKCDCVHLPAKLIKRSRHHPGALDPKAYFRGLPAGEQDRIFTAAGARAIRDGASMSSVVNARRGMYTADAYGRAVRATRDSATRRGIWYQAERRRAIERGRVPASGRGFQLRTPRLLPEEIYKLAAGNRDEAIRLLRRFGYLD